LHHGFTFKEHGGLAMLFGFSQRNLCHINLGRDYGNEFSRQIDAAAKTRFADVRRSTLILDFLAMTLEHSGLTPYDEPGADAPDVIAAVLYYIEQNLQRNITLKELAQRAFLCESRFSRVFRARTGLAPLQYIAKRKTSRAVAALKNTNIPAGEIGAVLGFNSLNYFSRFIKKNTGKSPSQIRESRSNTIR
jgi:AraC-like DNA-binding protein